ncbi:MAG: hypothetical protein ABSG15_15670 [FCB group bacterium]
MRKLYYSLILFLISFNFLLNPSYSQTINSSLGKGYFIQGITPLINTFNVSNYPT